MTTNPCCVWDARVHLFDAKHKKQNLDPDWDGSDEALPEYREQRDDIREWLKENTKKWAFQLESGEETRYLHFQIRFSLKQKQRKKALLELFDSYPDLDIPFYLEPTSEEVARSKDMFYVIKSKTRVAGPWTSEDEEVFIPIQYRGLENKLYPYQSKILKGETYYDFRVINLIIDFNGNQGKSSLAALCELIGRGIDVPPIFDHKELIQIVCDICVSQNERSPSPVIIDLPRTIDKKKLGGLYTAIEQIKKGKLYDPRHKYKSWWINSPHVWVFTNAQPEFSLLSNDRWKLWTISEDHDLVPYVSPPPPLSSGSYQAAANCLFEPVAKSPDSVCSSSVSLDEFFPPKTKPKIKRTSKTPLKVLEMD